MGLTNKLPGWFYEVGAGAGSIVFGHRHLLWNLRHLYLQWVSWGARSSTEDSTVLYFNVNGHFFSTHCRSFGECTPYHVHLQIGGCLHVGSIIFGALRGVFPYWVVGVVLDSRGVNAHVMSVWGNL